MVLTGLYLFYFKNKICAFVRDDHWSVRQCAPLLNSIFIVSLRSVIAQFLCRAMLCLFSVGRDILRVLGGGWGVAGRGEYKVTLKFLVLQNLKTHARVVQIHQVTNKLLNPKVSVAIKKVLGALVGWNGKRVFLFFPFFLFCH